MRVHCVMLGLVNAAVWIVLCSADPPQHKQIFDPHEQRICSTAPPLQAANCHKQGIGTFLCCRCFYNWACFTPAAAGLVTLHFCGDSIGAEITGAPASSHLSSSAFADKPCTDTRRAHVATKSWRTTRCTKAPASRAGRVRIQCKDRCSCAARRSSCCTHNCASNRDNSSGNTNNEGRA